LDCLEPADTALVTGLSGAEKTCTSKFVIERLREEVLDIEATYVNCWQNYTRFRGLYQILDDLGQTIDIHRQSTPHDELLTCQSVLISSILKLCLTLHKRESNTEISSA
jgi:Cdc6-like AAA superfamily ATPase